MLKHAKYVNYLLLVYAYYGVLVSLYVKINIVCHVLLAYYGKGMLDLETNENMRGKAASLHCERN